MTSDPRYNHLIEQSWRRKLTIAEEAELRVWLSNHPDAQPDSEAETALTEMLGHLPEAPVPSNFTARVLQAIERDETGEARQRRAGWRYWLVVHRWLPRVAFGCLLVGTGLFSYHHHHGQTVQRRKIVQSVEAVSAVSSLPSPEILKDFEAVRALRRTGPDEELIALLQ